jgi:hypothetical protein
VTSLTVVRVGFHRHVHAQLHDDTLPQGWAAALELSPPHEIARLVDELLGKVLQQIWRRVKLVVRSRESIQWA